MLALVNTVAEVTVLDNDIANKEATSQTCGFRGI